MQTLDYLFDSQAFVLFKREFISPKAAFINITVSIKINEKHLSLL
jgi:hypothetical protein